MTLPDVIVIRGAPGSGKSATAKVLAARLGRGARIEVDTLRAMFAPVNWTDQREHIEALSLAVGLVVGFVRLGHSPVIVVDTFSGDKLDRFLRDIATAHVGTRVRAFCLSPNWSALKSRIEARPADGFKDLRICEKLNADIPRHLQPGESLIDNSTLTPDECAELLLHECERG